MKDTAQMVSLMEHLTQLNPKQLLALVACAAIPGVDRHSQCVAHAAVQLYAHTTPIPSQKEIMCIAFAALGHDIGKNGVKEEILDKPHTLTLREFGNMQTHTEKTFWLLERVFPDKDIAYIAASHHEHWDGSGYPRGIKADNIHPFTRIITIADIWDALTHQRIYQQRILSHAERIVIMRSIRGTICDPHMLDQFLKFIPHDHQ